MAETPLRPRRGRPKQVEFTPLEGVMRSVDILEALHESPEPLSTTEVSRKTGINVATTYRILATLAGRDLVIVDPATQRYRLGIRFLQYGLNHLERLDLRREARPYLADLVAQTTETAVLALRVGDERLYVDKIESPQDVRQSLQLGLRQPLWHGASGKAILAAMPPEFIADYLKQGPFPALTRYTITEPVMLSQELEMVRTRGFGSSAGERFADTAAVAAAVMGPLGEVLGALLVCGPAHRFRVLEFGKAVVGAAGQLSRQLGYVADVPDDNH